MNRNIALKIRILLLFVMFSMFFSFVLAEECCVNPFSSVAFCQGDMPGLEDFCCGELGGFENGVEIGGVSYTEEQAQDYCYDNWIVDGNCLIRDECDIGCCVGQDKTCNYINRGECDVDPMQDPPFYENQLCEDVTECETVCCCDDVELKPMQSCDVNLGIFTDVSSSQDCVTRCSQIGIYPPCEAQSCEFADPNCACGSTALTDNTDRYCCGADNAVFSTPLACTSGTSCATPIDYSVSGFVRDESGNNIENVIVNVIYTGGEIEVKTDFNGYKFDSLPSRVALSFTASKIGFNNPSKIISNLLTDEINFDFVLLTQANCGDGIKQEHLGEQCDKEERNGIPGSGCTIYCTFENVCGNGVPETYGNVVEQCDDFNDQSGDGCSSECFLEVTCGDANTDSSAYISPTQNDWINGGEECDDGNNVDDGNGCSALCMRTDVPCTPGELRTISCATNYSEENIDGDDTLTYTYRCPTQENCTDPDGDGIGHWEGTCSKIDPDCPTICGGTSGDSHALQGSYCPLDLPLCIGDILSPDVVEVDNLGLICCENSQDCVEEDEVNICNYTSCEQENPGICECGAGSGVFTTTQDKYCCAEEDSVFGDNIGAQGCYETTNQCKPKCVPDEGLPQGKTYVDISSEFPDGGCKCGSGADSVKSSGYCCEDITYQQYDSTQCEFTKNFAVVQGKVTDLDGSKIEQAEVIIRGDDQKQGTQFSFRTITDADGEYTFNKVPRNNQTNHTIIASKRREFRSSTRSEFIDGDRLKGTTDAINFVLTPLPDFSVSGTVYDASDNSTISGAAVSVEDIIGQGTQTNANGFYLFDSENQGGVKEGIHMFRASVAGLVDGKIRARIMDDITGLNFSLIGGNCTFGKYKADPTIRMKGYEFLQDWDMFMPIGVDNVVPVKGSLINIINWTNRCPAVEFNIYRCEGEFDEDCGGSTGETEQLLQGTQPHAWKYMTTVDNNITQYQDTFLKNNTNYCYKIGVEYGSPFIAEVISPLANSDQCFKTGDIECMIKKDLESFCRNGDVYECDSENHLQQAENGDCTGMRCAADGDDKAKCVDDVDCTECNKAFGIFHRVGKVSFEGSNNVNCEDVPLCYEDYTNTTVNIYYDCNEVSSCYDYRSEGACNGDHSIDFSGDPTDLYNNRCLTRNCTWEPDPRYSQYGFGVCREQLLSESCPGDHDCDGVHEDVVSLWNLGISANDSVGDNDGTINGNPTILQGALVFDGVDDYIEIDSVSADVASSDITISAWIKTTNHNGAWGAIAAFNRNNGGNRLLSGVRNNEFAIYDSASWKNAGTSVVNDGNWHNVVMVLDDASDTVTTYVDGSFDQTFSTTIYIRAADKFSIGQEWDTLTISDLFEGSIDQVAIYGQALTEGEVMNIYHNGIIPDSDNDYSPDIYDYDPYTINTERQECERCDDDESKNLVFTQCDEERCKLYGDCYYDGDNCNSKQDLNSNCETYNKETDCNTDMFGFGACRWNLTGEPECEKDYDADNITDCSGSECKKDFNPPNTRIPHLSAYRKLNLLFGASIFDDYTASYNEQEDNFGERTYYSIDDGAYNYSDNSKISLEQDDEITDNAVQTYTLNYYSVNHKGDADDGVYNNESPINSITFEVDDVPPRYDVEIYPSAISIPGSIYGRPTHVLMYYDYNYVDDDSTKAKRFSYLVDSRLIGDDQYVSDLVINFTLSEPAVCKIELIDVDRRSAEDLNPLLLELNNLKWVFGNYGPEFILEWINLPDGNYQLEYTCYDKVFNSVSSIEPITIEADPSVKLIEPSLKVGLNNRPTGIYRYSTNSIPIEVETRNPFYCELVELTDSIGMGAGIPLEGTQVSATKFIHRPAGDTITVNYNAADPYYHKRVGCATRFGNEYKHVHFFIDQVAPETTFEKPYAAPYAENLWYSNLDLDILCTDPEIRSSTGLIGEFGCTNLTWCIGADCEPYEHDNHLFDNPLKDRITDVSSAIRALDICYESIDEGGNREGERCDIIKIDAIAPIIDDVVFAPKATDKDFTRIRGHKGPESIVGNYLTKDDDYNLDEPLGNENEYISDFTLEEFVMKFTLQIEKAPLGEDNDFELVRFRDSDNGYYALYVDASVLPNTLSLNKVSNSMERITYEFVPGREYEIEIQGSSDEKFTIYIDGEKKIEETDTAHSYNRGGFIIPKVEAAVEGRDVIERTVDKIRIGNTGRVSPISSTIITVNKGEGADERVYTQSTPGLSTPGVINYLRIDLPKLGNNSVEVCAADSAVQTPNTRCETFYAYQDHIGPVIEANIFNVEDFSGMLKETPIQYETPIESPEQRYAQFGYPINFSIYVEDEEWTEEVKVLQMTLAKDGTTIANDNINNPDENIDVIYPPQDPSCINDMNCILSEGVYSIYLRANDKLGTFNDKTYYFEIRDEIAPVFNITMSNPDTFENYALLGHTYEINITANEPISLTDMPEFWWQVPGAPRVEITNIIVLDNFTYQAQMDFTRVIGELRNLDDVEATFIIRGYDRQDKLGTTISGGKKFFIDTTGYIKPIVYYPTTTIYTNQQTTEVTGLEGEGESGRTIKVQSINVSPVEKDYSLITDSEWLKTQTTTNPQEEMYNFDGVIKESAFAGQTVIIIEPDANFDLPQNKYIDFATHNRAKRELYEIIEYKEITGVAGEITITPALEQDADVDGIFKGYNQSFFGGMFEVDAQLEIGEQWLYTFSYDERNVRSERADEVVRVFYDPHDPIITPIQPWEDPSQLLTPHFITSLMNWDIEANILENITYIDSDSIELIIDYTPRGGVLNTVHCNATGCVPAEFGNWVKEPDFTSKNITVRYEPNNKLEDAVYDITIKATDLAENEEVITWRFEVDKNKPHEPVVTTTDGVLFLDVLYTDDESPELYLEFRGDEGKYVNVSKVDLAQGNLQNRVQFDLELEWTNELTRTQLFNVSDNYTTRYKITLDENLTSDDTYYVIATAKKLFEVDLANDYLNFSNPIDVEGKFVLDRTDPEVNITMQTPTTVKTPQFSINTGTDPSNCSYYTDEQTTEYFDAIGFDFMERLEEHDIEMKQLSGVRYPETQHQDLLEKGGYTLTVSCENILGRSTTEIFPFNIVFPKINKVYYKPGETIEIILNLDEEGLIVEADMSPIGGTEVQATYEGNNQYKIIQIVPSDLANDQYRINITVSQGIQLIDETAVLIYYHNDTWTDDDFTLAFRCYGGAAGEYFGEWNCDFVSDAIYALDRIGELTEEADCFNDADDDGDGDDDSTDPDCAVWYEIRNQQGHTSAINYNDPEDDGLGRFCLTDDNNNDGYCDNSDGVQVYYTASNKPGEKIKILFVKAGEIQNEDVTINILNPPFGQLAFTNTQLQQGGYNIAGNIEIKEDDYSTLTLYSMLLIDVPGNEQNGVITNVQAAYQIGSRSNPGVDMTYLRINNIYSSLSESSYTEGAYSTRCIDGVDNDLDSGSFRPMGILRGATDPNMFDCRDDDCWGEDVKLGAEGQIVQCENVETSCYDRFDNDYDVDYNDANYDFSHTTGMDCKDQGCDNEIGAIEGQDGCILIDGCDCQLLQEENCNDGFNNDFLDRADCEMVPTNGNPSAGSAEYDCADSCRQQNGITINDETGNLCGDGLDNDWDAITVNGPNSYSQNNVGGVDCRYNHDGNHRADTDCEGTDVTITAATSGRTGSSGIGTCQLDTEESCSDNFDNDQDGLVQNGGWTSDAYTYFDQFGMAYSAGADCDDYDCAGQDSCPINESLNPAWCFDGIDNDLDDPNEANSNNAKDCSDIDCNLVENPDDAGQICEYGKELSCTDGFDNDGDDLTDEEDDDCTTGLCYPNPEIENLTIDSCSDGWDNDNDLARGEGADCSDDDCTGKPCGPNMICNSGGDCVSEVREICDDGIDNNQNTQYDCEDPQCYSDPYCSGRRVTPAGIIYNPTPPLTTLTIGGEISVRYTDYVRKGQNIRVRFGRSATSAISTMYIGFSPNTLLGIADVSLATISGTSAIAIAQKDDVGGILKVQGTASSFTSTVQIPVTANPGDKNIDITTNTETSSTNQETITVKVLENIQPTINGVEIRTKDETSVVFVKASDTSGIAKCMFEIGTWSNDQNDCILVTDRTGTVTITVFDAAGNSRTTTRALSHSNNIIKDFSLVRNYVAPDEQLRFEAEYEGDDILPGTPCKATITQVQDGAIQEVKNLTQLITNDKKCEGSIDISDLNNESYSVQVTTEVLGDDLSTQYEQFFKCRYTQFPAGFQFAGFHCMDNCTINMPLPNIDILVPAEDQTFTYPLINVSGNIEQNVDLEIFVNTFDESQYQARIENTNVFDTKAMVLAVGENTIIARVTDDNNLVNFDEVTINFDGVRVLTDVTVNTLPISVDTIDAEFTVIDLGETMDLTGTTMTLYKEDTTDIIIDTTRQEFNDDIIRITPVNTITDAGTYKVEILPKMQSNKYGVGEVYRFTFCPDGSHVFYDVPQDSRTNDPDFYIEGHISPLPKSAEFIFIRPNGIIETREIQFIETVGAASFTLSYPDLIEDEGINTYYIKTVREKPDGTEVLCEDIRYPVMFDLEGPEVEQPYIKGEE